MTNSPEDQPIDAGTVRYLRLLVTTLSATMVLGFIIIVVLFVIRFSAASAPELPKVITLPDGAKATAFTRGAGWYAVVTSDNRVLIYNTETGALRQTILLETE